MDSAPFPLLPQRPMAGPHRTAGVPPSYPMPTQPLNPFFLSPAFSASRSGLNTKLPRARNKLQCNRLASVLENGNGAFRFSRKSFLRPGRRGCAGAVPADDSVRHSASLTLRSWCSLRQPSAVPGSGLCNRRCRCWLRSRHVIVHSYARAARSAAIHP